MDITYSVCVQHYGGLLSGIRDCRPRSTREISQLLRGTFVLKMKMYWIWDASSESLQYNYIYNIIYFFFINFRRWGQSTRSTHFSPVHAYEVLSRFRFSTPTPRQLMVEHFVLVSSRFPRRNPEESYTPAETRTHKFRLSGRTFDPLDHGGSSMVWWLWSLEVILLKKKKKKNFCVMKKMPRTTRFETSSGLPRYPEMFVFQACGAPLCCVSRRSPAN